MKQVENWHAARGGGEKARTKRERERERERESEREEKERRRKEKRIKSINEDKTQRNKQNVEPQRNTCEHQPKTAALARYLERDTKYQTLQSDGTA